MEVLQVKEWLNKKKQDWFLPKEKKIKIYTIDVGSLNKESVKEYVDRIKKEIHDRGIKY